MLDTYSIATMGVNVSSTISVASLGIISEVRIEEVTQPPRGVSTSSATGLGLVRKEEKTYKITVKVLVGDQIFTDTKQVSSKKKPKVSNVRLDEDFSIKYNVKVVE
jgi:hypothetical protein